MRPFTYLLFGVAAFVAITYFEQLPIVGWLGGAVSIVVWLVLAREIVGAGDLHPVRAGTSIAWAAVVGGVTGLVGAFTAWLAQTGNLIGLATPPGDRVGAAFGFVGATLGLAYWPLVGAGVCALYAFYRTMLTRAS